MKFVQSVKGGYQDGKANVNYSIGDDGGLIAFKGEIEVSPLALLELLAKSTSTTLDDKAVAILEDLLANHKAAVASATP